MSEINGATGIGCKAHPILYTRRGTMQPRESGLATENLRGIGFMVAAVGAFSVMDALIKWLSSTFPVMQILLFRTAFALVPIVLLISRLGGLSALRTQNFVDHLGRSLFTTLALIGFIYAFGRMPLADVVAIGFSAPLFITALSLPMLGERVDTRRWVAVLVGFIGVITMVRPGAGVFGQVALVALAATVCYALGIISIRLLNRTETTAALVVYVNVNSLLAALLAVPFGFVWPTWIEAAELIAVGLIGGLAQLLLTIAYQLAPAAVVAPFDYTAMLYVIWFGYIFFGDLPDKPLIVGAAIVIGSGLYILHREARHAWSESDDQTSIGQSKC
jgi:drug/metabolite transporter (DMT)-like permease